MHPPSLFGNFAIKVGELAIERRTADLQRAIADKDTVEIKRLVGEIETFERQIAAHKATMQQKAVA